MKRSDLKELIKKSMQEVSPTSGATTIQEKDKVKLNLGLGAGNKYQYPNPREDEDIMPTDAMTPEELRHYEKMMGRDDVGEMTPEEEYEEERRAELDTPSVVHGGITMREGSVILNRDEVYDKYASLVKQYMESGLGRHAAISKAQNVLAKEYGATPLNIQSTISDYFDDQDRNATYANENVLREADEIVAAYAKKKLVKEALDFPRDAVQALADAYKNIEKIYSTFGRDSRFKDEAKQDDYLMIKATLQSINNKLLGLDSDFGYGQGAKLGYDELNEEMHGGYLELFEMNPAFEEGVSLVLAAWEEWKEGPETEPEMVEEAKHDILAYLSSMMN